LLLLDSSVIGNGMENIRYFPAKTSPVDLFIRITFLIGLPLAILLKKRIGLWLVIYFLSLGTLGMLTTDSPNLARTIPVLPFIYLISGLCIGEAINTMKKKFDPKIVWSLFILAFISVSVFNISRYFTWVQSEAVSNARQPALSYSDFLKWQDYQIIMVKSGLSTVTIYEWEKIKAQNSAAQESFDIIH